MPREPSGRLVSINQPLHSCRTLLVSEYPWAEIMALIWLSMRQHERCERDNPCGGCQVYFHGSVSEWGDVERAEAPAYNRYCCLTISTSGSVGQGAETTS